MSVRKYVGATARSMGCEPAWVAHCEDGSAAVFSTREAARSFVREHEARRFVRDHFVIIPIGFDKKGTVTS